MKHKVSGLEGALLDVAVAKAEGWLIVDGIQFRPARVAGVDDGSAAVAEPAVFPFSSDWQRGGRIIERERIHLLCLSPDSHEAKAGGAIQPGPTPLIAAMRAYVASKFGDQVEL